MYVDWLGVKEYRPISNPRPMYPSTLFLSLLSTSPVKMSDGGFHACVSGAGTLGTCGCWWRCGDTVAGGAAEQTCGGGAICITHPGDLDPWIHLPSSQPTAILHRDRSDRRGEGQRSGRTGLAFFSCRVLPMAAVGKAGRRLLWSGHYDSPMEAHGPGRDSIQRKPRK